MRVLLVVEEAAGVQALRLVRSSEHEIVAVVTSTAARHGRGATAAALAERVGIPVWDARLAREPAFADRIAGERVDLLLNVHSLSILSAEVVAAPRIGAFNLHPGPLPEYAGLNAPSWAIANGEPRHGVSLHRMTAEVDAGPIAYETAFEIRPADTGLTLSARCVQAGLPLLRRLLETAARDPASIPASEQDPNRRRVYGREAPHGGWLPWSLPARRVADLVRAADYSPWPSPWGHPRTRAGDAELEVLRASATDCASDAPPGTVAGGRAEGTLVAAADAWVAVERVKVGGRPVDPRSLLPAGALLRSATSSPLPMEQSRG